MGECSICLEKLVRSQETENNFFETEINSNKEKKIIQCLHVFHKKCIDTWLENNNSCPLCRFKIYEIEKESREEMEIINDNTPIQNFFHGFFQDNSLISELFYQEQKEDEDTENSDDEKSMDYGDSDYGSDIESELEEDDWEFDNYFIFKLSSTIIVET